MPVSSQQMEHNWHHLRVRTTAAASTVLFLISREWSSATVYQGLLDSCVNKVWQDVSTCSLSLYCPFLNKKWHFDEWNARKRLTEDSHLNPPVIVIVAYTS